MSLINLTKIIKRFVNIPVYKGPFDLKKKKEFKGVPRETMIEEFDLIKKLREAKIEEISPFHLVWRYKPMSGRPWQEKVILRRLGLHHLKSGQYAMVIVPNTPHYNNLLWEIKHLIRLKPVVFPDGIPEEKDIGATRIDLGNGKMNISEAFRISDQRLEAAELPKIFSGNYLREYLKHHSFINKTSHQRSTDWD